MDHRDYPMFMGFTYSEVKRLQLLCRLAGGIDALERHEEERRANLASAAAQNAKRHSAANTERASDLHRAMGVTYARDQLQRFQSYRESWPLWWVAWVLLAFCVAPYLIGLWLEVNQ